MKVIYLLLIHFLPALDEHSPGSLALLPTVVTFSVLPVPHLLQVVSPEWKALLVAFTKQLLTSHFPIPGTHYTDYQYCQSEHPPCLQSRCPTLMWPAGLC